MFPLSLYQIWSHQKLKAGLRSLGSSHSVLPWPLNAKTWPRRSCVNILVHHLLRGSEVQDRDPAQHLGLSPNTKELGTRSLPSLLRVSLGASLFLEAVLALGHLLMTSVGICLTSYSTVALLQEGISSHPTCVPCSQTSWSILLHTPYASSSFLSLSKLLADCFSRKSFSLLPFPWSLPFPSLLCLQNQK